MTNKRYKLINNSHEFETKLRTNQLPTGAIFLPVYPTFNTVKEVNDLAKSMLPITNQNAIVTLLGTYHNTLLYQLLKEAKHNAN